LQGNIEIMDIIFYNFITSALISINLLISTLKRHFESISPFRLVHPMDILNSNQGPYPLYPEKTGLQKVLHSVKEIAKKILGRKSISPMHLACAGWVRRK
jgi:hypothetical protein